ncbi:MAG: RidA family protein [Rhodospirillum sp.]|nr:RidA family protein [Rhodospirillum sp.]MCF8487809.1 RidA family protein [Rhodospirillum sp.]MCF8499907.1 RidA family protein [Rhodospirillum sp.]
MSRTLISSGSDFEKVAGYSRAVVDGNWVFVSGTTGFDYDTMTLPESLEDQTRQALKNIAKALDQAGSSMADVVRAFYIVTEREYAAIAFPILGETFGKVRPAATMIVAGLIDEAMKIEIQVTARKRP